MTPVSSLKRPIMFCVELRIRCRATHGSALGTHDSRRKFRVNVRYHTVFCRPAGHDWPIRHRPHFNLNNVWANNMKRFSSSRTFAITGLFAAALIAGPVLADKPEGAGKGNSAGKGQNKERGDDRNDDRRGENRADKLDDKRDDRRDGSRENVRQSDYFGDRHRVMVRDYYGEQFRAGRCPPGLAKKNNGCMPPGQAKKWRVGYQLPREVIYHEVPRDLVTKIGPAPSGYRYVQVAADILMIAIGTSMVVDAIQDLGR